MGQKFKKKLISILLICAMVMTSGGCGGNPDTLESLYSSGSAKETLDSQLESMKSTYSAYYSDITYEFKENDLIYNYYLSDAYDTSEAAKNNFEEQDWESTLNAVKDEIEKTDKIRPSSITYNYIKSDGSTFFSITK